MQEPPPPPQLLTHRDWHKVHIYRWKNNSPLHLAPTHNTNTHAHTHACTHTHIKEQHPFPIWTHLHVNTHARMHARTHTHTHRHHKYAPWHPCHLWAWSLHTGRLRCAALGWCESTRCFGLSPAGTHTHDMLPTHTSRHKPRFLIYSQPHAAASLFLSVLWQTSVCSHCNLCTP